MIRAPPRLPFPFAAHRSFRTPPDPGIMTPASGRSLKVSGQRLYAIRSNQRRGLGLKLRQLQDRDFGRTAHDHYYTAMRYSFGLRSMLDRECSAMLYSFAQCRKPIIVFASKMRLERIISASSFFGNQRVSMRSSSIGLDSPSVNSVARKIVIFSST